MISMLTWHTANGSWTYPACIARSGKVTLHAAFCICQVVVRQVSEMKTCRMSVPVKTSSEFKVFMVICFSRVLLRVETPCNQAALLAQLLLADSKPATQLDK